MIDSIEVGDVNAFEYTAPVSQTTHVVSHTLGRDPVAVQVIDLDSGLLVDNFSYVVLSPGTQCRIAFDIPLLVKIRMI